ncbi:MAG: hypothetical protein M0D53_01870 [Flavobacterium sp. JAD_PAG50586_2]|nr:MAG: hypothetical protein M0D53_01870 [Flavobacterium sp. JAD_PAG50586_2]
MKKRFYLLFILILALFSAYHIFISTNLFIPEQKEISKPNELFKEMFSEITKIDRQCDTIYFVNFDIYGICGNNSKPHLSEYQKKIEQINYYIQNPYFIDLEKSFDEVNSINNKVIIVGNTRLGKNYNRWFFSNTVNFDLELGKDITIYRQSSKIVNGSNVEIIVTANLKEKMKLLMKYKNGKWSSSIYK